MKNNSRTRRPDTKKGALILPRILYFSTLSILILIPVFLIGRKIAANTQGILLLHMGAVILSAAITMLYRRAVTRIRTVSLIEDLTDFCQDPALYEEHGNNAWNPQAKSLLQNAARRFSKPLNRLRFSLPQIEFTAETLQTFSEQFQSQPRLQADMSSETLSTAEQMSASNHSIEQAVEKQKGQVTATRESMNRLADEIHRIHQRLESSAENTVELTRKADQGEAAMKALLEANEEANRKTAQIQQVLDIINEVAERTNLLSLNASIEAARAGDAGRGFAVVAQEISNLATQTSQSVQQIARNVQVSLDTIQTTVEKARRTGELFGQLTRGLKDQNSDVTAVAREASNQNQSIQEIAEKTGSLSQQSAQILEATSEQARAMHSLSESFQRVSRDADLLSFRSTELEAIRMELMRIGTSLRQSWDYYNQVPSSGQGSGLSQS